MFSLICAGINGWVNNGEAGDLRRHRAHYDVSVIMSSLSSKKLTQILRGSITTTDPLAGLEDYEVND